MIQNENAGLRAFKDWLAVTHPGLAAPQVVTPDLLALEENND